MFLDFYCGNRWQLIEQQTDGFGGNMYHVVLEFAREGEKKIAF